MGVHAGYGIFVLICQIEKIVKFMQLTELHHIFYHVLRRDYTILQANYDTNYDTRNAFSLFTIDKQVYRG